MSVSGRSRLSRRHFLALLGATAGCGAVAGSPALPQVTPNGSAAAYHLLRPSGDPHSSPPAGALWPPYPVNHRTQFRELVRCGDRTLYVAGKGSDSNPGTHDAPLRQINKAIHQAEPGDLILVDSGVYGFTEVNGFHGNPDQWLGIMTLNDQANAVINVPPPTDNFVNVVGSSYVGIYGFEVYGQQNNPNTNGSGISVHGNSHHVALWKNHVHDFPGGGINCFDVNGSHDLVDVSFNTIHGTSRYNPHNTSGISIFASRDLTGGATFPDGYGYRVVGNYVYDAVCTVPFRLHGFDYITDGNGISLDSIKTSHDYTKQILVAGNIVAGCGGRGIHVLDTVNVDVYYNTAVGNLITKSPGITAGVEIEGKTDRTVQIVDNVICPLNSPNSTDDVSTYVGNVIAGGSQAVPPGNVDRRSLGLSYFAGPLSAESLQRGPSIAAFTPASP